MAASRLTFARARPSYESAAQQRADCDLRLLTRRRSGASPYPFSKAAHNRKRGPTDNIEFTPFFGAEQPLFRPSLWERTTAGGKAEIVPVIVQEAEDHGCAADLQEIRRRTKRSSRCESGNPFGAARLSCLRPPCRSQSCPCRQRQPADGKGRGSAVSHDGWVGVHVLGVVLFRGNLIVT